MRLHFQFRRYRLPFRTAVRTAHGTWSEREGIIVRLEEAVDGRKGGVGFGEAAPIPWFGTETVDEVEAGCRAIGEWIEESALEAVPKKLGCLRHALSSALRECAGSRARVEGQEGENEQGNESVGTSGERTPRGSLDDFTRPSPSTLDASPRPPALAIAALLPAGRAALGQIGSKAEFGFRVFKWKVGVGDLADELALLDDVCAALPNGAKLRLDANGAWDRRKAERWLERCAERPVEFVEQPCFAEPSQGVTLQRRTDDILLGLAGDYPTPIALDESLIGEIDLEKWIGAGWPGIFVVKPSLMGEVRATMSKLERAKADVVFSSALETAVGAKSALLTAFAWNRDPQPANSREAEARRPRALGFGVWPLFADARLNGPVAAPFLRWEDVANVNSEAVWNALS